MQTDRVFIFLCNKHTRQEVLRRMLVGTTAKDWHQYFKELSVGACVLVYDFDAFEFVGPFRAAEHKGGKSIDASAWGGKFPAQARIECAGITKCVALQEVANRVGNTIILRPGSDKPHASVGGDTATKLLEMFGFVSLNTSPAILSAAAKKPSTPSSPLPSMATASASAAPTHPHTSAPLTEAELRYKTVQGFLVRSKAEREIANLLDRFGVECHYERPIPHGRGFLCDFFLPQHDVYIEYWGLQGQAAYDTTRKAKTRVYSENGLRLLELEPADERDLESRLTQELRQFGIDIDTQEPSLRTGGWLAQLLRRIKQWLSS